MGKGIIAPTYRVLKTHGQIPSEIFKAISGKLVQKAIYRKNFRFGSIDTAASLGLALFRGGSAYFEQLKRLQNPELSKHDFFKKNRKNNAPTDCTESSNDSRLTQECADIIENYRHNLGKLEQIYESVKDLVQQTGFNYVIEETELKKIINAVKKVFPPESMNDPYVKSALNIAFDYLVAHNTWIIQGYKNFQNSFSKSETVKTWIKDRTTRYYTPTQITVQNLFPGKNLTTSKKCSNIDAEFKKFHKEEAWKWYKTTYPNLKPDAALKRVFDRGMNKFFEKVRCNQNLDKEDILFKQYFNSLPVPALQLANK